MFVHDYELENIGLKYCAQAALKWPDSLIKHLGKHFKCTRSREQYDFKTLINYSPELKLFISDFIVTRNLKKK